MKQLYDYHLKQKTIANLIWHQFIFDWLEQESPIIELYSQLLEQQQNGSKRRWECEDLQNTNLSICESKRGEKFMGYYVRN